jgi:hypothetical protein
MCAVIGRRRDRLVLQLACGSASPLTCTGTGLGRAVVSGPEAGGATGLASAGTGRLRRRALSPNRCQLSVPGLVSICACLWTYTGRRDGRARAGCAHSTTRVASSNNLAISRA